MIRGFHLDDGSACHSMTCGLEHRPPLGEEYAGNWTPDENTLKIRRRTPEERDAYFAQKRAELVAAGKLIEAAALDSVTLGEPVSGWIAERAAVVAEAFHEAYERLARDHGYVTRERSAVPWAEVPEDNKGLMIATATDLLRRGVIR